jgi:hypothetical protein
LQSPRVPFAGAATKHGNEEPCPAVLLLLMVVAGAVEEPSAAVLDDAGLLNEVFEAELPSRLELAPAVELDALTGCVVFEPPRDGGALTMIVMLTGRM